MTKTDNTIAYQGNRYALPLGSYEPDRYVALHEEENMLVVLDSDTGKEIIHYPLSKEKGRLFKNSNCRREKDKGIDTYLKERLSYLMTPRMPIVFLNWYGRLSPAIFAINLKSSRITVQTGLNQ